MTSVFTLWSFVSNKSFLRNIHSPRIQSSVSKVVAARLLVLLLLHFFFKSCFIYLQSLFLGNQPGQVYRESIGVDIIQMLQILR